MEIANFLLGGFLGTAITFVAGLYINERFLKYKSFLKAIKSLDMSSKGSFSQLHFLLMQCQKCNPTCMLDGGKFYKQLKLSPHFDTEERVTKDDLKRATINNYLNNFSCRGV